MLRKKPYTLLWYTIPFYLIIALFSWNDTIDFQIHDSYFVMASIHNIFFSIFLLGIFGFFYWLLRRKRMIDWMVMIHVISLIFIPGILSIIVPRSVQIMMNGNLGAFNNSMDLSNILLFIFVLCQILFFVNVVISVTRNTPKTV